MKRTIPAALAGVALCCPAPTRAQDSYELPVLTIFSASGSLTAPSAARQIEDIRKTPGGVAAIDSESVKNAYNVSLADLLKETPGVFAQNRYSQEVRLAIRGSGISRSYHTRGVEILQDGVPFNMADGSGDFYQIDPLAFRVASVYRGGNALAFGASTLGGAVDFATPTARTVADRDQVRLEGGSFGTLRVHAQSGRVAGAWDGFVSATFTRADGWRQHERQNLAHLNANVGYRIDPSLETRFYFGVYRTDQELPGTLSYADALRNPRKASAAALAGDQARNTYVERLANKTTLQLASGQLDLTSWITHKSLFHPIFQVVDQDGVTLGLAPRYTGAFELAGHRNEVVAGARLVRGVNEADQYVNVAGSRGAQTLDSRQTASNAEAYVENRFYFLPPLALVTGLKAYSDKRDYLDRGGLVAPGNAFGRSASATYNGVAPRVGLLWEPWREAKFFANVTRSADVPDFTDLNQTIATTNVFVPLRQQRATTFEIGARGEWDRFGWDLTLYRSQVRDELLQYTTNPSIPAATFNAPSTLHQGVEFAGSFLIARGLADAGDKLSANLVWTYSDFRFRNDPQYGGDRLPLIPANVIRASLTYAREDGFYITPTLDLTPRGAFADYANTFRTPGYALFGLRTGKEWKNGLSIFVEARNLANRRFIADAAAVQTYNPATYASFYPGVGRSIFGGARYAF